MTQQPDNGTLVTWITDRLPTCGEYDRRDLSEVAGFAIHHSKGIGGPQMIATHHTAGNGWPGIGYPLVVYQHAVYQTADLDLATYHAGRHNTSRIGICFVGDFDDHPPPQVDLELAAQVLALIAEELRLPRAGVMVGPRWGRAAMVARHRDLRFASRRSRWDGMPAKSCPGDRFPMSTLAFLIEEYRERPLVTLAESGIRFPHPKGTP